MFDRLIDLLLGSIDALRFWCVLYPYESGVMLRLGKFVKVIEPGTFTWRWPFIDHIIYDNIAIRASTLGDSSTTTTDGVQIGFDPVVTYRIKDIQKALLEVDDVADALRDSCLGTIGATLASKTWAELQDGERTNDLLTAVCRKAGWKWGVEIIRVQLATLAKCKTLRLMQSGQVHSYGPHH
jgi:regulator of protease activity HflC (stomatin/prohibitin superfamily)